MRYSPTKKKKGAEAKLHSNNWKGDQGKLQGI